LFEKQIMLEILSMIIKWEMITRLNFRRSKKLCILSYGLQTNPHFYFLFCRMVQTDFDGKKSKRPERKKYTCIFLIVDVFSREFL
jgi:hypothetical protein